MNQHLLQKTNLWSKIPLINAEHDLCENCGQMKILCRRRVPYGDTDVFVRYGPCQPLVQFKTTKYKTDREIWQKLGQTSFDRPGKPVKKNDCGY